MKNNKKKFKRLFYLRVVVLMTFFLGLCLAFSSLPVQAARLFGVTGDGASTPETLFELDQDNATSILPPFLTLGNGIDGEAIAFNQTDGLLYHLSGFGFLNDLQNGAIFESINPNTPTLNPPINYDGFSDPPALAFTYDTLNDVFLVADFNLFFYSLTAAGEVTKLSTQQMDHNSKGLAFAGEIGDEKLYSIQQKWSAGVLSLFEIDPADGSTISSVPLSLTVDTVELDLIGSNGLATHPDTGVLWGLLRDSDGNRHLVTFANDPVTGVPTGVATEIGITDHFASIAFGPSTIEFSDFTLKKTMVKFRHKLNNDEFMVKGKFVLGEGNDGIDPVNEDVTVNVGTSSIIIPSPYSFVEETAGKFKFMGKIDGVDVKMKIVGTFDTFHFRIMAKGVDLMGTHNPVDVELVVGNDKGQSSIRLKGELNSWKKGKKWNKHHGDDNSSDDDSKSHDDGSSDDD